MRHAITHPTRGQELYGFLGRAAENLPDWYPGKASAEFSATLMQGLLEQGGEAVAGWADLFSPGEATNWFTGDSVTGASAWDARFGSGGELIAGWLTGGGNSLVKAGIKGAGNAADNVLDDIGRASSGVGRVETPDHLLPDNIRGDGLGGRTAQDAVKDLRTGTLPGRPIGGLGTPREMPATSNPSAAAEEFALQFFGGKKPADAIPTTEGGWRAEAPDGTWVTYRPAGQASGETKQTTASIDINGAQINQLNGGPAKMLKLKFPLTGATGKGEGR